MSGAKRFDPKLDPTPWLGESTPCARPAEAVEVLSAEGPCIVVLSGPRRGESHALGDVPLVIGRDARCDLSVDDASASRFHAEIVVDAKGARLRDLDSTNGTFLNGVLRSASRELVQGDRFRIGDTELIYVDPSEILLEDPVGDAGPVDRRSAGRASSVVFYSSGRIEGRGILFDVSGSGARILDASANLAPGAVVLLMSAGGGDPAGPPVRGVLVRRDATGFAVRFDPPDERLITALLGLRR